MQSLPCEHQYQHHTRHYSVSSTPQPTVRTSMRIWHPHRHTWAVYIQHSQTGRKSVPIHVPGQPNVLHIDRKHLVQSLWPWHHASPEEQSPPTRRQSQYYYHPVRPQGTPHHRNYPSLYRARFNSIQRNNSSMSSRKHHLSLEPREVWICDMFAKRFNISSVAFYICIYSLPHLVCL